jgi:hypothetical protein
MSPQNENVLFDTMTRRRTPADELPLNQRAVDFAQAFEFA